MKTKIVYTLICDGSYYYYEQLLISLYSLRLHNPHATVLVLVDKDTEKTLCGTRTKIYDYATQVICIEVPEDLSQMQRSRYLKTNLRQFVNGDYLFLDTDTVVCDKLDDIDTLECEIGGVLDYHGDSYTGYLIDWDKNNIEKMGWQCIAKVPRFNSGLLYVKDCDSTRSFYQHWFAYWTKCKDKGINIDQLSLRRTLYDNPIIEEIDSTWHCQLSNNGHGIDFINQAKVVHYYNLINVPGIRQDKLWESIKRTGQIPEETICILKEDARFTFLKSIYLNAFNKMQELEPLTQTPVYTLWKEYPLAFSIFSMMSRIFISIGVRLFKH